MEEILPSCGADLGNGSRRVLEVRIMPDAWQQCQRRLYPVRELGAHVLVDVGVVFAPDNFHWGFHSGAVRLEEILVARKVRVIMVERVR